MIPSCMDTKISTPYLKSWPKRISEKIFPNILRRFLDCENIEYNIQVDHINMILIIPPKQSVADVIGQIKAQSTSRLRKKFSWLACGYL